VSVPNVVGLSQAAATTAITNAGLVLGTVTQQSSANVPAGNVISQNPGAGASVAAGSAVDLVVSSGPAAAVACDVNTDGKINKTDISLITAALNKPASGPTDPRDPDRNGIINVLDARQCVLKCDLAQCAVQ
jgi:beta-lactam-binding protein with PASTA domain